MRLNEPYRWCIWVNNAGDWVQNQLNCGQVRFAVERTRARHREKILSGIDVA
jgi:hypothetical protein